VARLALALLVVPAARAGAQAEVGRVEDTFPSGGEKVAVERYQPAAAGKHPAILLLPAIDGLDKAHGDLYRRAARHYAHARQFSTRHSGVGWPSGTGLSAGPSMVTTQPPPCPGRVWANSTARCGGRRWTHDRGALRR
jgi:hypothetical protein